MRMRVSASASTSYAINRANLRQSVNKHTQITLMTANKCHVVTNVTELMKTQAQHIILAGLFFYKRKHFHWNHQIRTIKYSTEILRQFLTIDSKMWFGKYFLKVDIFELKMTICKRAWKNVIWKRKSFVDNLIRVEKKTSLEFTICILIQLFLEKRLIILWQHDQSLFPRRKAIDSWG